MAYAFGLLFLVPLGDKLEQRGLAVGLMLLAAAGLAISGWPNILPPDISIWEAAAPPQSLGFALVGALLIIPFILMYTAFAYYVFRGKVRHGDGYY